MLTDVAVFKLKHSGGDAIEKHSDRDGLYLAVSRPPKHDPKARYGSKTWRYEYRFPPTTTGKRQTLTYGRYPDLSLADAREKHLAARRAIADGKNPAEQKQNQKLSMLSALGNVYESIAVKWFESERAGKSKSWIENNDRWLKLVNKTIGTKPIGAIGHDDVYQAVRPLEEQGYAHSAERARQQIAQVFTYAIRKRLHSGGNIARDLKGEIRIPEHVNNRHIKAKEIPDFLKAVDGSKAAEQTKIASRLLLLTIVRKQELLAAKRSELDLDGAIWEIPAERMKNKTPHLVPLSRQAVELFRRQMESSAGEYVFPSLTRPGKPMGLSTLNVFFDRIGIGEKLTPHGLRSVASTALNGSGAFRVDVIERQLSHVERNKVRNAYNKADYLDERRRMMTYWADYVYQVGAGKPDENNVVPFAKAAAE
jgi:integrase